MAEMLATRTEKRCSPDRLSLSQVYMRARWYDPQLQRFISRDPIGVKGGANLYRYVNNSPANWVDPSGMAIQLRGSRADIEAYLRYWEEMTDLDLDVDKDGYVYIKGKGKSCKFTSKFAEDRLRRMLNLKDTIVIDLVNDAPITVGSPGTLNGSDKFHHGIDMADLAKSMAADEFVGHAHFLHENAEALAFAEFSGPLNGRGSFWNGHAPGINAENAYLREVAPNYQRAGQTPITSNGREIGTRLDYGAVHVMIYPHGR